MYNLSEERNIIRCLNLTYFCLLCNPYKQTLVFINYFYTIQEKGVEINALDLTHEEKETACYACVITSIVKSPKMETAYLNIVLTLIFMLVWFK